MALKILSYNIQAGLGYEGYGDYLRRFHYQLFFRKRKSRILDDIAEVISDFDIVCLQEVDTGGRRSGYTDQAKWLAERAGFSHRLVQTNRVVGKISRHGNAIFSKRPPLESLDLKLPGRVQGRGVQIARFKVPFPLTVVNTHLSLGLRDQTQQLAFIRKHLPEDDPVVLCGDLNCESSSPHLHSFLKAGGLNLETGPRDQTFPSWKPQKGLDHICQKGLKAGKGAQVLAVHLSDHLPVMAELTRGG